MKQPNDHKVSTRYQLKMGEFGAFFYDDERNRPLTLDETLRKLNESDEYAERLTKANARRIVNFW